MLGTLALEYHLSTSLECDRYRNIVLALEEESYKMNLLFELK